MKVAGLHVLSHSEDQDHAADHCTVCDHAITHNLTPALALDEPSFSVENTTDFVRKGELIEYHFALGSSTSVHQLFSRPPPALWCF
ncbi:hypothetical protein [Tamlana crocina]|uniref:Uncharacterized protein n=1 Tax=Tamlana crocina TaxID=393006 RepID=A0ABX1D750_9FLAO|nr:hypothetical protein [Tamlana crocina]NJX14075.1 hypothetical protein [Tamlana crocina]